TAPAPLTLLKRSISTSAHRVWIEPSPDAPGLGSYTVSHALAPAPVLPVKLSAVPPPPPRSRPAVISLPRSRAREQSAESVPLKSRATLDGQVTAVVTARNWSTNSPVASPVMTRNAEVDPLAVRRKAATALLTSASRISLFTGSTATPYTPGPTKRPSKLRS